MTLGFFTGHSKKLNVCLLDQWTLELSPNELVLESGPLGEMRA